MSRASPGGSSSPTNQPGIVDFDLEFEFWFINNRPEDQYNEANCMCSTLFNCVGLRERAKPVGLALPNPSPAPRTTYASASSDPIIGHNHLASSLTAFGLSEYFHQNFFHNFTISHVSGSTCCPFSNPSPPLASYTPHPPPLISPSKFHSQFHFLPAPQMRTMNCCSCPLRGALNPPSALPCAPAILLHLDPHYTALHPPTWPPFLTAPSSCPHFISHSPCSIQ